MHVRPATHADIERIAALWAVAAGPTRLAGDATAITVLLDRDPEAMLVAEGDGDIVGTLVVGWDGWRCHLYRMAVDPTWRRRGVASTLLEAASEHARRLGARRLDAMVRNDNEGGIGFWAAAGYERDPEDTRWSLLL